MLQPISFSVIFQALDWHAFPRPFLRQLSFYEWDDDYSAEYRAVWLLEQLDDRFGDHPLRDGDYVSLLIMRELQECFCEDVSVVQMHWDAEHRQLQCLLYVTLSKTPIQLYLLP